MCRLAVARPEPKPPFSIHPTAARPGKGGACFVLLSQKNEGGEGRVYVSISRQFGVRYCKGKAAWRGESGAGESQQPRSHAYR